MTTPDSDTGLPPVIKPWVSVLSRFFATAGGAGYVPYAPGTAGTIVAVPLAYALSSLHVVAYLAFTVVLTLLAIVAAHYADLVWGTHDSGRICIDEVAGYLVTVAFVNRHDWWVLIVGFVLFRVFDQIKLWPARWLDEKLPGGPGVVLDDIAAGVHGAIVMAVLTCAGAWPYLHKLW